MLHVGITGAPCIVQAQSVPASQGPQRSARLPQSRRPHLTGAGAAAAGEVTEAGEGARTTQMAALIPLAATLLATTAATPTAVTSPDGQRCSAHPTGWRWTVHLDDGRSKTGVSSSRQYAIYDAANAIEKALSAPPKAK